MNTEEIVKNMIAFHNSELIDWQGIHWQGLNGRTREDIINYVQESINELQGHLESYKKEVNNELVK